LGWSASSQFQIFISLPGPRGRETLTCSREVGPTNHHKAPPARASLHCTCAGQRWQRQKRRCLSAGQLPAAKTMVSCSASP
jgi:hypothetical protein